MTTLLDLILEEPTWWAWVLHDRCESGMLPSQDRDYLIEMAHRNDQLGMRAYPVTGGKFGRIFGYKTYDEAKAASFDDKIGENGRIR